METIQGTADTFQWIHSSLPLAGVILAVAVLIALVVKGKAKQGVALFGSFLLYQVYLANQGTLVNTINTVEAVGNSSGIMMGFAGFSLGALALLACLSSTQTRN